jgi:hypothetical protein
VRWPRHHFGAHLAKAAGQSAGVSKAETSLGDRTDGNCRLVCAVDRLKRCLDFAGDLIRKLEANRTSAPGDAPQHEKEESLP